MASRSTKPDGFFRGLFESAPVALVVLDSLGRLEVGNNHLEILLGYTPEELLDQRFEVLLPPQLRRRHRQLHKQDAEVRLELQLLHKDGRELPIEMHLRPLHTDDGLVTLVALHDRSAQVMVIQDLKQRVRQQRVVAELGVLAMQTEDIETLMDMITQRLCQALQVDYCGVLELLPDGQTMLLRAGTGWREGYVGTATVANGRGSLAGYTLEVGQAVTTEDLGNDGRFFVPALLEEHGVVSSMTAIIYGTTPYGVLGIDTRERRSFTKDDISLLQAVANLLGQTIQRHEAAEALERLNDELERRMEERTRELQASEARFSQAFHASPAPTAIIDLASLRMLDANEAFLKLLGYTRHELLNRSVYELNTLLDTETRAAAYAQLRAGQAMAPTEVNVRTKAGGVRTVIAAGQAMDLGKTRAGLVTMTDISERKQTEEQLARAVQAAVQDASWFSHAIMEKFMQLRLGETNLAQAAELTKREREVLVLVAKGWDNKHIAAELGLAQQTVHNYLNRIYEKLNLRSRAELIVWARQRGLLAPE